MKILILIACIIVPVLASAVQDNDRTPEESQMCSKRVLSRRDPADPNWGHMHHYCDGLRFYDRAVRSQNLKADFGLYIQNSLAHFDYVLKATSQDFKLRPEVMVMRGRTLELAGNGLEAVQHYNAAIQMNPNFAMGYAALGNFYAKNDDKAQALKVYEEGLRRQPANRYLRSRYKVLGGKKIPEPTK